MLIKSVLRRGVYQVIICTEVVLLCRVTRSKSEAAAANHYRQFNH
jgi:hypothetical protein